MATTDSRTLNIGPAVDLPVSVVTHTIGVVGQKRSGKTSTAVVLVEEAHDAGACVLVIDPTGAWLGLNRDGDGPGLDCIVMGRGGDVPLSSDAGRVVANFVVDSGQSVVCTLKGIPRSEQVRFVADLGEEILELGRRRAVTVVIDEAPRFVPQSGAGAGSKSEAEDASRCRRAVTELVTLGGVEGIGSILIAQRPSAIHKDVFEQSETLVIHRLKGNNDRKAIAGWLEEAGADGAEMLVALPNLRQGEAILLASEHELATRVKVRPKRTFDTSATPDVGQVMLDAPAARSQVDLAELEKKMGAALKKAEENDPAALKRKVKRLEAKLAEGAPAPVDERAREELDMVTLALEGPAGKVIDREKHPIAGRVVELYEDRNRLGGDLKATMRFVRAIGDALHDFDPARTIKVAPPLPERGDPPVPISHSQEDVAPAGGSVGASVDTSPDADAPALKAGARRMLEMLLRAPRPLTRPELSTLAVVAAGGTMSDYLSALRTSGMIVEEQSTIKLTVLGERTARGGAPGDPPPLTPDDVVRPHLPKLKAGARRMLDLLMRARADGFTRAELSRLAGVSAGGTFSDYLSSLRKRGLIEERNRRVYPGAVLYLWEDACC